MRNYCFIFQLAWLCVLGITIPARGQAGDSASPFIVDSWSNEEGLPQSSVISIVQAHDGCLWLGTLNGLVRFDGIRFTVFNQMNTPGMPSDRIVFLFEDSRSNLWAGTESAGLLRVRNGVITSFADTAGNGRKATDASEDANGNLWFNTAQGLFRYRDNKMDFYPGILRQFFGPFQQWQNERKKFGPFPWGNAVVKAACNDRAGNIIVGTLGEGVFWSDTDGQWQNVSTNQGLSKEWVLSLCLDREGNLWVGTDGGGLNRIKRKTFIAPASLPLRSAQSLSPDADGGFWTAFNAVGFSHWNENNAVQNYAVGKFSGASAVLVTRQQQVWAGTPEEGLFLFDNDHFVPAPASAVLGAQIFALFEDNDGKLWAGTQKGLGRFDGRNWKLFTVADGLSEDAVRAIAQDATGTLWAGTWHRGLNRFKDGKFTAFESDKTGLPGDDISCLYADKDGALWVGTFGHGLARFKDDKWQRFSMKDGLASDSISYVLEDDGDLWVGSNSGLMRIRKRSLADFVDGKTDAIFCRTYGKADGLPTRECSIGSEPSACRTADGRLWFPTVQGVASLDRSRLKSNVQRPVVLIESVLVDGRQQKTNQLSSAWPPAVIVAPGGDQSKVQLEIHYTALDFSAPELVRFKYQLEGYQNGWTEAGSERVARYPLLPPGDYRFNVIAVNEDGVADKKFGALEVVVLPQFWQTGWFRIGVIVLLLVSVVAAVRYISTQKLHRQLHTHRQREALESERARIARDLHDQLGANLTQVALLGEMAEADKDVPDEVESHAQQISQTARETTRSLDEIVWAVNPANDTLEGLINYCFKYAQEFFALANVRCRVDAPAQLPPASIPPEVRHNVFLAFKEAVNNVVKHAHATEARIRLRTKEAAIRTGIFILEIEDNGRGVSDPAGKQNRNGLRNMRKRMEDIGGSFSIGPREEGGTVVRLVVPID
jgi:ligand-binding sensor domain-containing protein/signal transduction histidine kinase